MKKIKVPFSEKEQAKSLGAKWSAKDKSWFIPKELDERAFKQWTTGPQGNTGVGGLYVDLVPKNAWLSNIRSALSKKDWDLIRKKVYKQNNYRCQICGGYGEKHPVEAHERWSFNIKNKTQKLVGIEALCPRCHQATHFGLASVQGRGKEALEKLISVNGWSLEEASTHIEKAFNTWSQLNKIEIWTLDLSWLNSFIELSPESQKIIKKLLK